VNGCAVHRFKLTPLSVTPPGKYKRLSLQERIISCWFMVTGVIHFVIEGEFERK
jgi:hypothetical protein